MTNQERLAEIKVHPLTLWASCLASKWGFDDGDLVIEYVFNLRECGYQIEKYNRDESLKLLVETYLAPVLVEKGIDVQYEFVGTCHNPIRVSKVNGVDVDWRALNTPAVLEGISVTIPANDVVNLLLSAASEQT
jgi:hypothetical protein